MLLIPLEILPMKDTSRGKVRKAYLIANSDFVLKSGADLRGGGGGTESRPPFIYNFGNLPRLSELRFPPPYNSKVSETAPDNPFPTSESNNVTFCSCLVVFVFNFGISDLAPDKTFVTFVAFKRRFLFSNSTF